MFLAIILAAQAAAQPAPAANFPIFGLANATCQEWNSMKPNAELRAAQAGFVAGVLTGANLTAQRNVVGQFERDRMIAYLDQQCAQSAAQKVKIGAVMNAVLGSLRTAAR